MPTIEYNDAAGWGTWSLTNLEISGDTLVVTGGQSSGTALSPAIQLVDNLGIADLTMNGAATNGAQIRARIRTAAASGDLGAADWSPWVDTWPDGAVSVSSLGTLLENAALDATLAWCQLEVSLANG